MTAVGYRVTRWADDFVVVCRTRQEAQTARALAGTFLRKDSGSASIRRRPGSFMSITWLEFLGYKVSTLASIVAKLSVAMTRRGGLR